MIYTQDKLEELRHRWTTPSGKQLVKTIKSSHCYLSPVLFREKIKNLPGINDTEVEDSIDLRGINLSGFDFRVHVKEDDAGFSEEIAILSNIHLEGSILKHSNFENGKIHNCYFEDADISHSGFNDANLNSCSFQGTNCTGIGFHGAKLVDCNFTDAVIKDLILSATLADQKTTFGKELKSEKEKSYHLASIECKQIKEMYKNSSLHAQADHYHYKEMVIKRKIIPLYNPLRWLNYIFGDLLCKYGTSFTSVLLWSALVIVVCAFLLNINHSLLYNNAATDASFLDALYFSIVSFTTLGYGDFHAIGLMRFVAGVEAFAGVSLMSLFTVIVARKIIRD